MYTKYGSMKIRQKINENRNRKKSQKISQIKKKKNGQLTKNV
jgi:hypothetical protein